MYLYTEMFFDPNNNAKLTLRMGHMQLVPMNHEEERKEEKASYEIFFCPYDLSSDNRLKYMNI